MTSIQGSPPDPVVSTRAPYVPFVMVIGAVIVIGVTLRLLNPSESPAHPLSGAPVEGTADGAAPPSVARAATGSLQAVTSMGEGPALRLGPAAFPPGASVALSVLLPSSEQTFVTLRLQRLAEDGTLASAAPINLTVAPDAEGRATVETSVAALTEELGNGIYRIAMVWNERVIGEVEAAVGLQQPSGVAIFDEPRPVAFAAGEHSGVIFNRRGRPAATKDFNLGSASSASAAAYARFNGSPYVLIVSGVWAGHWMPLSDEVTLP